MLNGGNPRWGEPFQREIAPLYIAALQLEHWCSTPLKNERCHALDVESVSP